MFSENSSCFRSYFGRYLYLLADYVKLDDSVILTSNWDLFPPIRGALKAKINFFILFSPFLFFAVSPGSLRYEYADDIAMVDFVNLFYVPGV